MNFVRGQLVEFQPVGWTTPSAKQIWCRTIANGALNVMVPINTFALVLDVTQERFIWTLHLLHESGKTMYTGVYTIKVIS